MVKLLIADDEQAARNTIADMLQPLGHKIFTADCATQALEMTKREYFDLVLLDNALDDVGGILLMADLKKINPNLRCIMLLSSISDVQAAVTAIQRGAADYISKPFREADVMKAVTGVLHSMFGADGNARR